MASEQVLREKLAERAERFEALSRELEDPAVAGDARRFPAQRSPSCRRVPERPWSRTPRTSAGA